MQVPKRGQDRRQHGRRPGREGRQADGRRRARSLAHHRPEAAGAARRASRSRSSSSAKGMPIGAKVTLRGDRMWEFLDRLLTLALPRIRDFRGLSSAQFDGQRQLHLRPHRAVDVPRDRPGHDRPPARHGHHGRHHSQDRRRGTSAAARARLPVQGELTNGEEGTASSRRQRKPKFAVRGYIPLPALRATRVGAIASSACAESACGRWRTPANCPASPRPAGDDRQLNIRFHRFAGRPHAEPLREEDQS